MNDDTLLIGALVIGAFLVMQQKRAMAGQYTGPTSVPGNVGTGLAQAAGGLLGNLFAQSRYGNNANGTPNSQSVLDNINFFKANPVQDITSPPVDYNTALQQNPELLNNLTTYGV
jgi:hypothetical protein